MATQDRVPTGAGDFSDWTPLSGSSFSNVDDPVGSPDDDSTYIASADAEHNEAWTFAAFAITSSAVTKVSVTYRARETAGDANSDSFLKVGAGYDIGGSFTHTTSYSTNTTDWLVNPNTGLAWTEAEVEGTAGSNNLVQFGIRSQSMVGGDALRCTQAYLTVDYTAAGGGNTTLEPSPASMSFSGQIVGLSLGGDEAALRNDGAIIIRGIG